MAKDKDTGFFAEFKKFITRGNVMDMAVGVIIGGAFTAIINSAVKDLLMPILSLIIGKVNFSDLKWVIKPAAGDQAEVALTYGNFIQAFINFILIALVLFLIVRFFNRAREKAAEKKAAEEAAKKAAEPAPAPDPQIVLLTEIRDLLKKQEA